MDYTSRGASDPRHSVLIQHWMCCLAALKKEIGGNQSSMKKKYCASCGMPKKMPCRHAYAKTAMLNEIKDHSDRCISICCFLLPQRFISTQRCRQTSLTSFSSATWLVTHRNVVFGSPRLNVSTKPFGHSKQRSWSELGADYQKPPGAFRLDAIID